MSLSRNAVLLPSDLGATLVVALHAALSDSIDVTAFLN
jgi:hypothetical protein